LVVHGGSGLDMETYHKLVQAKVSKINISTSIKECYMGYFKSIHTVKNPLALDKELLSSLKQVVSEHLKMFQIDQPKGSTTYAVDLHCHTNRSDGNLSPADLVKHALQQQMSVIAITDHDMRPPMAINMDGHHYHLTELYDRFALHVLPGIEVSCETLVEDVHILGYGCDFTAPFFQQLEEFTITSKINAYKALITKLNAQGMALNFDEIIQKNQLSENAIQKKHIFQEIADKGYVASWREAKIMVQSDERFIVYREKPDPSIIIDAIHQAGGIAVLAHPYLIPSKIHLATQQLTREAYISQLIEAGLDGLEIQYSYDKTSYTGGLSKSRIRYELLDLFGKLPMIFTGGSDYHADELKGVTNAREMGENGITLAEFNFYPALQKLLTK